MANQDGYFFKNVKNYWSVILRFDNKNTISIIKKVPRFLLSWDLFNKKL